MHRSVARRYSVLARWYDTLSLEWPVYRVGRSRGIEGLELRAGDRLLDICCGTGLNFPLLRAAVGATGEIVGVDANPAMADRARRRVADRRWRNVTVRVGDAAQLSEILHVDATFNAVVFTYALSVIDDWREAFRQAIERLGPGGRVLIVDLALPSGRWRLLAPLAALACRAGGSDWRRRPWRLLTDASAEFHLVRRGGHVQAVAAAVS